jgi:hypothetical protein
MEWKALRRMGSLFLNPDHNRRRAITLLAILAVAQTGCAVHYENRRTGVEHLWGLGQLRVAVEPVGNNFAQVTTGCRIPGLAIEVGPQQFGFSFGYTKAERLILVPEEQVAAVRTEEQGLGNTNSILHLGHARIKSVPATARHGAVVTGRAVTGLGARAGRANEMDIGWNSRHQTQVIDPDIAFSIDQDSARGAGFDLFSADVHVETVPPTTTQTSP